MRKQISAVAAGLVLVGLLLIPTYPQQSTPAPVSIQVDGRTRFQTIDGFGAALTPFEWDGIFKAHDPAQPEKVTASLEDRQAIARLLFTELGLTHARLFLNGFEPANDNENPFTFNNAGFDWTWVNWRTDFVSLARPYGLQTWWATFTMDGGEREAWLRRPGSACALDPRMLDEEVEWLLAAALHFRELGLELPYLAVNNEPDLCPPGFKIEIGDMVTIVKRLGARLREVGLATKIIVSDGWIPENAVRYMEAVLSDPEARQYVGVLAYHAYSDGYDDPNTLLNTSAQGNPPHVAVEIRERIRALAERYNMPVWMTEVCYCTPRHFTDFELLRGRLNHLHDELTIANISAFEAMNLYFLDRPGVRDELVHVYFRPDGALDRYEISTYGYLLGHYARYALPGSVRIQASTSDPRVRVTAFERPDGKLAIMTINNNPYSVAMNLVFSGVSVSPDALSVLTSLEGEIWESEPDIAITNATASASLPPLSVTTFLSH